MPITSVKMKISKNKTMPFSTQKLGSVPRLKSVPYYYILYLKL